MMEYRRKPGGQNMLILSRTNTSILLIDISAVMDQKVEAIKAYGTQFDNKDSDEPQTISYTDLESTFRQKCLVNDWGKLCKGFISKK
jgi:LmbE family N-acetylglucosaminyl deacetylase